jgi:hypothetical protein
MGMAEGDGERLVEAVLGLERSMGGIATILEQQGEKLDRLLELVATPAGEEQRLHALLEALIRRLDVQEQTLRRVEAGFRQIGSAVEQVARQAGA